MTMLVSTGASLDKQEIYDTTNHSSCPLILRGMMRLTSVAITVIPTFSLFIKLIILATSSRFTSAWTTIPTAIHFRIEKSCPPAEQCAFSRRPCPALHRIFDTTIASASTSLGRDEEAWKKEGESIIKEAAINAGARDEQLTIEWKSGRILVIVDGNAVLSGDKKMKDDDDDDDLEFGDDEIFDGVVTNDDFDETSAEKKQEQESSNNKVDIVTIARAINRAFETSGEGSIGYNIAVHHEIEVTTPGASNELSGIMFEAYKGFDVIAEVLDPKKNKMKIVEGKLVERTEELTIVNQKGRMRKLKNSLLQSVKLPKAKKEKGVR